VKIRVGFISNSSASSFICCTATIKDELKAEKYLEDFKNISGDIKILTKEEVIAEKNSRWGGFDCDWAGVYYEPKINEDETLRYLVFESYGGAGDSDFCDDDEDCYDMDYDVSFKDFTQTERHFINEISEQL